MKPMKHILAVVLALCLMTIPCAAAEVTGQEQELSRLGVAVVDSLPEAVSPFAEPSQGKELLLSLTTKPFYTVSGGSVSASLAALPVDITGDFSELSTYGLSGNARRGYVFRIELDPGVYWDDGSQLTARDLVYTLVTYIQQGQLPLSVAKLSDYLNGVPVSSGDIISLQKAGYASLQEAKADGHHTFYLDVTHFWGLDYGWQPVTGRFVLHDQAIPSGISEMFLTPNYLYRQYLADGRTLAHDQKEFLGIATESRPMTMDDVGMIVLDPHQLLLVLDNPTTVTALALTLSELVILRENQESFCSYGPYAITQVTPGQITLRPNGAWRGEDPWQVDEIHVKTAS